MGTGTVRVSDLGGNATDAFIPITVAATGGFLATNGAWPWADQGEALLLLRHLGKWGSDNEWPQTNLDENGYPLTLAASAKTNILQKEAAWPGDYVLLWDGIGSWSVSGGSTTATAPNRIEFTTGGSFRLILNSTDPADHARNVRIVRAEDETLNRFTRPLWADSIIAAYPAGIRYMNWQKINGSTIATWADRPGSNERTWTKNGAPLEELCSIANELRVPPWFHVPHLADDDYIAQMAALLDTLLDPGIVPRIEYSNEVSNTTFGQHDYTRAQGLALGLSTDGYQAAMNFVSRRTAEIGDIFAATTGRDFDLMIHPSSKTNTYPEAIEHGTLLANHQARLVVTWNWYFGFGANQSSEVCAWANQTPTDPNLLIDDALANQLPPVIDLWGTYRAACDGWGVRLGGYEGGHHWRRNYGCTTAGDAYFHETLEHPRMFDVYRALIDGLAQHQPVVLAHYNDVRPWASNNTFGARDTIFDDPVDTPRWRALLETGT
jgi:hypothetical protein